MKTRKPPVIDKDLEAKAFRVFLKLISDENCTNSNLNNLAYRSINIAIEFDSAWIAHCIQPSVHSTEFCERLDEYHPGIVYDQIQDDLA
jgi:hypothetical protein